MKVKPLPDGCLPTELQIYQHFLHLEKVKIESGEWNNYTSLITKAKLVSLGISEQWDKTSIPHEDWSGRKGKRVERLITSVRNFKKGRNVDIYTKFGKLFSTMATNLGLLTIL